MKTYIVEGGIGKQIAFTALTKALAQRDGDNIQIYTPHIDVYKGNPYVKSVIGPKAGVMIDDPMILESEEIIYREPYFSDWMKGEEHIIQRYCIDLGVEFSDQMKPVMFSDKDLESMTTALKYIKDIGKPYIITQFYGGDLKSNNAYMSTNPGRNYPLFLAQRVVDHLNAHYKGDVAILNYSLPQEPSFKGAVDLGAEIGVLYNMVVSDQCLGIIGIDSALQHCAAAAGKPGAVIWGNTYAHQSGYRLHHNLFEDFHKLDPRRIMVEPGKVVSYFIRPDQQGQKDPDSTPQPE